ncbi:glycosyltransferase family 2 protein [Vibrio sp. 10N.261.51.F12]|uniref:glycosyltransferase family 2 protein n=1 Tax=Vibrio sp. 10N.261.51.F12 TaxID=3229679 RepID=UPI00354F9B92
MAVFIAVVSHGHGELINQLKCLEKLAKDYTVIVKSNMEGDDFQELNESTSFHWINHMYGLGFGKNNNVIYGYCKKELSMSNDDYFVVLNPDVIVSSAHLCSLVSHMNGKNRELATINLFKDKELTVFDPSIRRFPTLVNFILSFLGAGNKSIMDKATIKECKEVDWAAGSFLCFSSSHYEKLEGFNESYFMYCEDIDICYRSHLMGVPVTYYPNIKAIHLAKHANRKFLSKHFYWHVSSVIRFLINKNIRFPFKYN